MSQKYGYSDSEASIDFSDGDLFISNSKDAVNPEADLKDFGAIKEVSDEEEHSSNHSRSGKNNDQIKKYGHSSRNQDRKYEFMKKERERRKYGDPISIKPSCLDYFIDK